MKPRIALSTMDFKSYVQDGFAYVDKSGMISELIRSRDVFLVTRPRRFGKSMNLNMLECFFSNRSTAEEVGKLFGGLKIRADKNAMECAGGYPVVSLSFSGLVGSTWADALVKLSLMMRKSFEDNMAPVIDKITDNFYKTLAGILNSKNILDPKRIADYSSILSETLKMLTQYLKEAYGKRVILLIDEYDAPLIHAHNKGYYTEAVDFIKLFLGAALKDNLCLEFAVVTGVVQIARESIFSDLNNLVVCDAFNLEFAGDFGFTEAEVLGLAKVFGREREMDSIRDWYNGYEFRNVEIYNPWSVMSYFRYGEFRSYWANTSENTLIQDLLRGAPSSDVSDLLHLLAGGHLEKTISTRLTFRDLRIGSGSVFSLMATAGYLKAVPIRENGEGHLCMVALPNKEMPNCFHGMFKSLLTESRMGERIGDIVSAMLAGDEKGFESRLNDYLIEVMSTFDSLESFYHGFMVSLAGYAYETHEIRSNRESGTGRYDLSMTPRKADGLGVLMEFKKLGKGEDAERLLDAGLGQSDEKRYALEMKLHGIRHITYTMVFDGKVCHVRLRR